MILLVFSLFVVSLCDIPVHCEFPDIQGTWTFYLTEKNHNKSAVRNECDLNSDIKTTHQKTFQLTAPNLATDENGYIGSWTMVFDQGFEVTMNDDKYFAFFKYEVDSNSVNFTSTCDQTFTGTYHRNVISARIWGCFYGKKTTTTTDVRRRRVSYPREYFYPDGLSSSSSTIHFQNDVELVNRINSDPTQTWTATTYPELEGERLSFGRFSHPNRNVKSKRDHMEYHSQFKKDCVAGAGGSGGDLPANWDWRNISGVNYVSPVRAQLMCGSCYSFATMGMFEARQRIQTDNQYKPVYSPQDVLDCSLYSQGCDGGMPFMVTKYATDFGVVDESCDPYRGESEELCTDQKYCSRRTFAYEYNYVGGYYGAADEENMMRDVYERGPVVIAFNVYHTLKQYQSGIFTCPSDVVGEAPTPKFYPADHAVLIVGYGVNDNNEKYWIVKNSWGAIWGMDGYFLIKKGVNECNVETLAVNGEMVNGNMFES